jgi:hypothetical protein
MLRSNDTSAEKASTFNVVVFCFLVFMAYRILVIEHPVTFVQCCDLLTVLLLVSW